MFQWGWRDFLRFTRFLLVLAEVEPFCASCHAGKGRTGVKHFGLYQCVPASTSEPFPGSGSSVSSHSKGLAVPAQVTSAAHRDQPGWAGGGPGKNTWGAQWFVWWASSRPCFHSEEHQELRGFVALQGGEPQVLDCEDILCRRWLWGDPGWGCGDILCRRWLWGDPRMGLWAVGTPSAGGGSKVAPRFPGWGSRLPWDCLWHTFSIRMISKAQIPRAYQSLTGQIALPTKLNIAFYLIILGKPSPQQEAITAGD